MVTFRTLKTPAPLRVVQVGAGGMGRAWLRTITANDDVELVGVVDLDTQTARSALAEASIDGVIVGTSVTEVALEAGAQAVVNVTIPEAHLSVNQEALLAGLPVLCEKPASPTVADALIQSATATVMGELLMISQSRRYFATLYTLRDQVRTLGEIGTVSCEFFKAPHFGGFREEMEHVLLLDMAIHQFDVARYLIGHEPVSVYCEEHNPGWSWFRGAANATAVVEFEGGTRFVYTGSWCAPGHETSWNGSWRISGEHGTALWDGEAMPVAHRPEELYSTDEQGVGVVPEALAGALAEFVSSLRSGVVPSGEIGANVRSLAMVEAAIRSADSGERVWIDDVLSQAREAAIATADRDDVRRVLEDGVLKAS
ncbi:Gfo/Idh/MocA family oxidoreductase [Salinisphaera sp. USBA-960]|nr:Gfo/Idh/MocA family oxidoreductase [Salifodinibacter halophilus]NNC25570.1 Gfo/Idh/MocA family oxidoreductase [Salifodinibacter halophilus]